MKKMLNPATWKTYVVLSKENDKVVGGCIVREHKDVSIGLKKDD